MQYFLAILAFMAVLVGIRGNTWDQRRRRLTPLGWTTVGIATASTLVSIVATYRDHKEIDWEVAQRARVRSVAEADLREALDSLIHTFDMLWMNADSKLDTLEFDSTRFYRDAEYLDAKLRETAFRDAWSRFDLREEPEYPSLYPSMTWGQFFSESAIRADSEFEKAVTKYSAYLDTDTMVQVHSLQSDEFFRMRMKELPILVTANTHVNELPIAFLLGTSEDVVSYLGFVEKLTSLANTLPSSPR